MKYKPSKINFVLLVILIFGVFFRFINFQDRVGFGQDSARDAIIALYSINHHKLPLLGPPSSAWAFNFGPLYYYVVAIFTLIIPGIFSPWIGFTLLSVSSVYLAYKTGEKAFDKKFGLIFAFISAISFAEIANSTGLSNTLLVSFAAALSFYLLAQSLKSQKKIFPLLLGFSVALAVNSHLQALSLLALLPLAVLFSVGKTKQKLAKASFVSLGFVLSFTPLIIFEFQHNLAWIKSLIDYSLHGQQKFYTPVRWLTEFSQFWPRTFGQIMSGLPIAGYFYAGLILLSICSAFVKKIKLPRFFYCLAITFIIEIISVRLYKGSRSPEYFIIAHQFVLFFIAFSIWITFSVNKILGMIILLLISVITVKNDLLLISLKSNAPDVLDLFAKEKQYLSGQKAEFYGMANSWGSSIAIYYLNYRQNITGSGLKLVICDNLDKSKEYCPVQGRLFQSGRLVMYSIESLGKAKFNEYQTESLNAQTYYDRTYDNYELRNK